MTANLNVMIKFRDAMVAEDFGRMAELGYIDTEFTMYGCAFWDKEKDGVFYKISTNDVDIYDFIERSGDVNCYPSNILVNTVVMPVPLGTKEIVEREVKKATARKLRELYPKDFLKLLDELAQQCQGDSAAELLWAEVDDLEGVFDEKSLDIFEQLIHAVHSYKAIQTDTFERLKLWIEEERGNMADNYVCKDLFEKTMYGFIYQEGDETEYVVNAQAGTIYNQMYELEERGVFVSPIYAKKYWYNYTYRLNHVIQDFKAELKKEYDGVFLAKVKKMRALARCADEGKLRGIYEDVLDRYGEAAAKTLLRYATRWGMR